MALSDTSFAINSIQNCYNDITKTCKLNLAESLHSYLLQNSPLHKIGKPHLRLPETKLTKRWGSWCVKSNKFKSCLLTHAQSAVKVGKVQTTVWVKVTENCEFTRTCMVEAARLFLASRWKLTVLLSLASFFFAGLPLPWSVSILYTCTDIYDNSF